jgi:hypothetical protein
MTDKSATVKKMDNSKLIDIVKNYKRYGYDVSLKDTALQILKERGIDDEMLRLTGNLTDQKYESAQDIYKSFNKSSKTSFIFYGLLFLTAFKPLLTINSYSFSIFILIYIIICYITCLIFILKSLISYSDFYKAIGKHLGVGTYLVFIISGLFAYFFVYFYYKKEMKEDMKMIN